MPRAVWTGSISFGLVNIPVRLYPGTSPKRPRFHLVDRQTGQRVRYRRVVGDVPTVDEASPPGEPVPPSDDRPPEPAAESQVRSERPSSGEREVAYEDLARGYEITPGEQVVVEQEELEALRPEPSRTIDIEHFVSLAEIDPVHFEKSYQLGPADDIAEKPYALLREAMERTGRVAVGRFVLRTREHLVVIRPTRGILGLETMYFGDEVRDPMPDALEAAGTKVKKAEIDMARGLIEVLSADWDPGRYRDPYRERVLELIKAREPVEVPEEEVEAGPSVTDLMDVLKASVEAAREAKREATS
jgi:DNA end-binding protein Ku